jgi:hypothetical protein
MANITISDGLLILATVAGPILAVQAQKWIERVTEKRRQRLLIFSTLMTTRATRLATDHVQALNMIDLVFNDKKAKDKAVIDAWRQYVDLLNQSVAEEVSALTAWATKREDLFVDLLFALSQSLGFGFNKVELRRSTYYPNAPVSPILGSPVNGGRKWLGYGGITVFRRAQDSPSRISSRSSVLLGDTTPVLFSWRTASRAESIACCQTARLELRAVHSFPA